MCFNFTTIASGSNGNCIYISTENTKILVDAGMSGKKIEAGLEKIGISGNDIDAVFVTHEHIDHTDGIGVMSRRYNLPVYATNGTWSNMPKKVNVDKIDDKNIKIINSNEVYTLSDLAIKPFDISHDAKEPVGFSFFCGNKKISLLTDTGRITKSMLENIRNSDGLLIESNHDENMLLTGSYPYELKQRILSDKGHISNTLAGKVIACVANENTKFAVLCHLSQENNTPQLAYNTVKNVLFEYGINTDKDIKLSIASKYGVEGMMSL